MKQSKIEARIYGRLEAPEDLRQCVVEVFGEWNSYQCSRKRGHGPDGLYCKQHAKKFEVKP